MIEGKVQKNENGVYVMVQALGSGNRHYYQGNFWVDATPMSDGEVREAFKKHIGEFTIEDMKDKLKYIDGFATSNVTNRDPDNVNISEVTYDYNTLFAFTRQLPDILDEEE